MLEVFTFIVSLFLLILPIADWTSTYLLRKANKKANSSNIALKERARIAFILAVASTLNASLGAIRIFDFHPGSEIVIIILSISLILSSIPNLGWLYLYTSNRLRK